MTVTPARDARLAWIIGGSLLAAHSAVILMFNGMPMPLPGGDLVLAVVWAGALLVLAFGIRRSGSVVSRRPLGVTALVVAAVMPIVSMLVWVVVPVDFSDPTSVMVGQALAVIDLAALAVAAVAIARAGAVPHRLRWVPLIVLAVCAGVQIAVQAVAVTAPDARAARCHRVLHGGDSAGNSRHPAARHPHDRLRAACAGEVGRDRPGVPACRVIGRTPRVSARRTG